MVRPRFLGHTHRRTRLRFRDRFLVGSMQRFVFDMPGDGRLAAERVGRVRLRDDAGRNRTRDAFLLGSDRLLEGDRRQLPLRAQDELVGQLRVHGERGDALDG